MRGRWGPTELRATQPDVSSRKLEMWVRSRGEHGAEGETVGVSDTEKGAVTGPGGAPAPHTPLYPCPPALARYSA